MKEYPLTEKKCLAIGGHCYRQSNVVLTSNPPQYVRKCKHCGKVQIGVAQPDMRWRDSDTDYGVGDY